MLTAAQIEAIKEHVALDEHTKELIALANRDLYHGPIDAWTADEETIEHWPGFSAACSMIRDAIPGDDLYLDVQSDEVIGDTEPEYHGPDEDEDDDTIRYYPDDVMRVDSRTVVRALVGSELARYV